MPKINDIVKFVNPLTEAAEFCRQHNITGVVVRSIMGVWEINTGFSYYIYAKQSEIEVIVTSSEIPVPEDV